jgi:hypothetical protein
VRQWHLLWSPISAMRKAINVDKDASRRPSLGAFARSVRRKRAHRHAEILAPTTASSGADRRKSPNQMPARLAAAWLASLRASTPARVGQNMPVMRGRHRQQELRAVAHLGNADGSDPNDDGFHQR